MYIGNDLQVAESGNKIIDDISSSFNGSTTSFALTVGGYAPVPFPINTQQIYVSVNGIIQEPDPSGSAGFKLSGTNIVFSSAPASGHAFFGVILSGADYVTVGTEFPAGSATAPSITFGTDNDTGMYSVTSGQMGFTSNGVQTFTLDSDGFRFNDNKKLICGSGSDLNIYHNGTDSIIDNNTGELKVYASQFTVKSNDGGETQAVFAENGAVSLYHNNVVKAATTSGGINVTGTVTDDGATHDGDVQFTGDSANVIWDKSVDDFIFWDNAKATFGSSSDLSIYHDGTHSYVENTTGSLIQKSNSDFWIQSDTNVYLGDVNGNEVFLKAVDNGAVELYHDNTKKFNTESTGAQVFGNLRLDDNDKFQCGNAQDLQIYHSGSHSFIKDGGTGNLQMWTNQLSLLNAAGDESMIQAIENGAVELYYDNAKTFETISGGATVTGQLYVTAELNLINGSTNAHRYIDAGLGDGNTLTIRGTSGGDSNHETLATFTRGGNAELFYNASKKFHTSSDGATVLGSENGEARLYLCADEGDDNADKIHLAMDTSGNLRFRTYDGSNWNTQWMIQSDGSFKGGDGRVLYLGAGNDLQLQHDGTNNFILAQDGDLNICCESGHKVVIQNGSAGNHLAEFNYAGAVELFYNGTVKLETATDKINFHADAKVNADNTYDLGAGGARWKDLYLSGGVFVGGTGTANELDDYEEGTWTPQLGGTGNSFTYHADCGGWYTKVGRLVTMYGVIRLTARSGSGHLTVHNFPFTAGDVSTGDSNTEGTVLTTYTDNSASGTHGPIGLISSSAGSAYLYHQISSGNGSALNGDEIDATFRWMFQITYVV